MKKIILSLLMISALSSADAGVKPADFPSFKDLEPPSVMKRDVGAVELGEEILASTADDYANMRIFDGNGVETPFLVRNKRGKKTEIRETSLSMEKVSLNELPDNSIEIIMSQKHSQLLSPKVIVFSTRLKNFEKQVSVYGSSDMKSWTAITENKPVFDYSRFFDIENKRVEISDAKYRHYKIVISNISESKDSPIVNIARETRKDGLYSEIEKTSFVRKDFKIDQIRFLAQTAYEVKTKSVGCEYKVLDMESRDKSDGKETVVTFSTHNVPLTKLSINTDDSNFSRQVRLEGCDSRSAAAVWKHVASGTLTKIRMGRYSKNNISISTSPVRFKHYRLTITNHDSPPLSIEGLNARGEIQEAVFFRKDDLSYRILYGGEVTLRPRYDIASVLSRTDGEDTDAYSLGSQKDNPEFETAGIGISVNRRNVMIIVIVIMVAALLWIITRATKNIEEISAE